MLEGMLLTAPLLVFRCGASRFLPITCTILQYPPAYQNASAHRVAPCHVYKTSSEEWQPRTDESEVRIHVSSRFSVFLACPGVEYRV